MQESKFFGLAWSILLVYSTALLLHSNAQGDGPERNFKCPPLLKNIARNCEHVNCGNAITEELCPPESIFIHNFALCGCCPSCVRFLGPEDPEPCVTGDQQSKVTWTLDPDCDKEDSLCAVRVNECLPGFACNNDNKCEFDEKACQAFWPWRDPDTTEPPKGTTEGKLLEEPEELSAPLDLDQSWRQSNCMCRKSLYRLEPIRLNGKRLHHWDPKCEPDGTYSPKQCKGSHYSGECFCVKRDGSRIFGREWRIQAENQTCACSRKVAEIRSQGLIGSYHCTTDGNFEPLQCDSDSGLCYCVEPKTGNMLGPALPQEQWKFLPCYSLNMTDGNLDGKYLRTCESIYAAFKALQIENNYHGTKVDMPTFNCDYDGSYGTVLKTDLTSQCVFKNGTRIKDFMKENAGSEMLCNCARDVYEYYPDHELPRQWDCVLTGDTGNYDKAYDFGTYSSCVDPDGFLYGDIVSSWHICCLLEEGCSTKTQLQCYNNVTNLDGYKPCSFWPYRN